METTIIEIDWQGPFSLEEIESLDNNQDFGLYQIYGTHNIFGSNSLLYIGKARDQHFSTRINQHSSWLKDETYEPQIYVGRFGGESQISDKDWGNYIDYAEKLLIYFCSPPYNSQNIIDYGYKKITDITILNFGKINRLPYEVSTYYNESKYWEEGKWKSFEYLGK